MLAVVADATVSGQQSFIIDRGEQVHTLEAAKALLAAQVAAFPPQVEEAYDDEEPFDIEVESEVETEETEGLTEESAAGEEAAAKPMPRVTSASGGGGGVAVPASRAKAAPRATAPTPRALRRTRLRSQALPMKPKVTKTNPRSSPARLAPIRRRTASGGPAVADVAADAAGAADRRKVVWSDRSRTNSGRHRPRKSPARWPISTDIPPNRPRRVVQPEPVAPPPEPQPADHVHRLLPSRSRREHPAKRRPPRRPKEPPRAGVRPCARR